MVFEINENLSVDLGKLAVYGDCDADTEDELWEHLRNDVKLFDELVEYFRGNASKTDVMATFAISATEWAVGL